MGIQTKGGNKSCSNPEEKNVHHVANNPEAIMKLAAILTKMIK
jgi:hypothetical protein